MNKPLGAPSNSNGNLAAHDPFDLLRKALTQLPINPELNSNPAIFKGLIHGDIGTPAPTESTAPQPSPNYTFINRPPEYIMKGIPSSCNRDLAEEYYSESEFLNRQFRPSDMTEELDRFLARRRKALRLD